MNDRSKPPLWLELAAGLVIFTFALVCVHVGTANAAQASCYGPGLYGNRTANGTVLRPTTLGVAHRTLPFGTRIKAHDKRTKLTVTLRVIDRGPYHRARTWDLTEASVKRLGYRNCRAYGVRSVRTWRVR